jgi:PHD/YefM family antitoxin component YafN of YafNO toxin-antitoxin module
MITLNATNARKKIYSIIENVNNSHEPIHITGKKHNAVLLSEDDWSAISETLFLSNIPGISESIKKGLKEPLDKCSDNPGW